MFKGKKKLTLFFQSIVVIATTIVIAWATEFNVSILLATICLFILVTIQFIYLKKRTFPKQVFTRNYPERTIQDIGHMIASIKKNNQNAALNNPSEIINKRLFENFQSNLQREEQKEGQREKQKKSLGSQEVILSLSEHSKKPKPKKSPILEKTTSKQAPTISKKRIYKKQNQQNIPPAYKPPVAKETLSSKDFIFDKEESEKEALFVLNVAKNALESKKYDEGLKAIEQWLEFAEKNSLQSTYDWEVLYVQGKLQFAIQKYQLASETWMRMLKTVLPKEHPQFLKTMDSIIDGFKKAQVYDHFLPFLFTALNEYRILKDHKKMDQLYLEIEHAYSFQDDTKRLLQTLQNHIAIKKLLKDYDGQLELLDQLGKIYFDQGDQQGSNHCYEQSIQIRKEMLETKDKVLS